MFLLKEKLRPLWHQEDNWQEQYRRPDSGPDGEDPQSTEEYIELSLYDIDGKLQPDCRLSIDTDELIHLIRTRIQKGVNAFFRCMEKVFQTEEKARKYKGNLHIFLAGNAGKSIFTRELFQETIDRYQQAFKALKMITDTCEIQKLNFDS